MRELICDPELFILADGDIVTVGRRVAWREDGKYYLTNIDEMKYDLEKLIAPEPIATKYLTTPWNPAWKEAPRDLKDVYIKKPQIGRFEPDYPNEIPEMMLREIKVYEILAKHPHPNICPYYGCVREGDVVTAIAIKKFPHDLDRWDISRPAVTTLQVLRDIKRGLDHLHGLELIHGDLTPSNIMLDDRARPILIDFNMTVKEGTPRAPEVGSLGWCRESSSFTRENDFFALGLIARALEGSLAWEPRCFSEDEPSSWSEEWLMPKIIAISTNSVVQDQFERLLSDISASPSKIAYLYESQSGLISSGTTQSHPNTEFRITRGSPHEDDDVFQLWPLAGDGLRFGDVDIIMLSLASTETVSQHATSLEILLRSVPTRLRHVGLQPSLVLCIDGDADIGLPELERMICDSSRAAWAGALYAAPEMPQGTPETSEGDGVTLEDAAANKDSEGADAHGQQTTEREDVAGARNVLVPCDEEDENDAKPRFEIRRYFHIDLPIPEAFQNFVLARPTSTADPDRLEVLFWDASTNRFRQEENHVVLRKDLAKFIVDPPQDLSEHGASGLVEKASVQLGGSEPECRKRKRSVADKSLEEPPRSKPCYC